MLKRLIVIMLVFTAVACGKKDSKEKLEELKSEESKLQSELDAKKKEIAELEKTLHINGDSAKPGLSVSIREVGNDSFSHYIEVQGRIESDKNIFLTPKAQGAIVTEVKVNRGDRVSKGQLLASMDGGAMLRSMQEVENQLDLATTVFFKQKNLWDQKIGTEIQYLQAKSNKESLERRMATLREQYSNYQLRSPINGTVDDVNLKVGEMPIPGMSGIRVVNYDDSKVIADVSESYSGSVKKGDNVIVRFPDLNKEYRSKVRVVGRVINTNNRTFLVEIPVSSDVEGIRPNMVAIVKMNDYSNNNVITVPLNVIQRDEKNEFVYVAVQDGKKAVARKKIVKTGKSYGGQVEILEGLSKGDKLISAGYQNVVDGQAIEVK